MSSFSSSEDPCVSSPCQNGGRCVSYGSNYVCYCPNNFQGLRCERADFCASSPCRNGGTCQLWSLYYRCFCPIGYVGVNCDISILCEASPCRNGGTCQSWYSNYWCYCPAGYFGFNCDISDFCASSPCQNGGTCQSGSSYYRCFCPTGYVGVNCDIRVKSQDLKQDFTTPRPTAITDINTTNISSAAWLAPIIAIIVLVIIITTVYSCKIAKKRKRRQRDQQLGFEHLDTIARSINGIFHLDTRDITITSLSEPMSNRPTSVHPYNVHFARRDSQTSTCFIEHISLSERALHDLSPQQPHLDDNEESRLDGGRANDGYDHVRDLPPTYLSVVTDPRYIRDEGNSLQLPPSYEDVIAMIRPTPAPSDGPVTSAVMTS